MKSKFYFTIPIFSVILVFQFMQAKAQCSNSNIDVNTNNWILPYGYSGDDVGWDGEWINLDADESTNEYVVVASADFSSNSKGTDIYVFTLNASGTIQNQQHFDYASHDDAGYAVEVTSTDSILICGVVTVQEGAVWKKNFYITRLDKNLNEGIANGYWPRDYGSTGNDEAWDIKEDHDGNYIVVGTAAKANGDLSGQTTHSSQEDGGDIWVLKLSPGGYILDQDIFYDWTDGWTGPDYAKSVIVDCDGNYVIGSFCNSCESADNTENYLLKLDPNLNILASNIFGKTGSDHGSNNVIQPYEGDYGTCESDDPYLSLGVSHTPNYCFGPDHDYWAQKSDNNLNDVSGFANCPNDVNEGAIYGGQKNDMGFSSVQTCEGYLLAGFAKSPTSSGDVTCNNSSTYTGDMWIVYVNKNTGALQWVETINDAGTANTGDDGLHSIKRAPDGSYFVVGYGQAPPTNNGGYDVKVATFELTNCPVPTGLGKITTGYCGIVYWSVDPCKPSYNLKYKFGTGPDNIVYNATSPYQIINPGGYGNTCQWWVQVNCSPNYSSTWYQGSNMTIPYCNGTVVPGWEQCTCEQDRSQEVEVIGNNMLSVYPNPSNGSIKISLQLADYKGKSCTINLLDQVGKVISSSIVPIENGLID